MKNYIVSKQHANKKIYLTASAITATILLSTPAILSAETVLDEINVNEKKDNYSESYKVDKSSSSKITQDLIDLVHKEKDKISPSCKTCTHPCGNTSDYDMSLINDKKKELMNQILNLSDMNFIYRGLCYLGFDIDDSYIDELIEEGKK